MKTTIIVKKIVLERPHIKHKDSYLAAFAELEVQSEKSSWVYLGETEPLDTPAKNFGAYVSKLNSTELKALPTFVKNSVYWAVREGEVIGRIAIRHELNEFLSKIGGHIGYIVRPSYRKMGIATEMLRQILMTEHAHRIGRLLLTCDENNIASEKTIVKNGGVFEGFIANGAKPRKSDFGARFSLIATDPILKKTKNELINKYRCHTVLLYGSRARGDETERSDYDVMGVRRNGKRLRIAKKLNGHYLDLFIFSESDLKTVGEQHIYMSGAKILFDKKKFGARFLRKLKSLSKRHHKTLPADEIQARRVWAHKMLDRILVGDTEAHYRKVWLLMTLLSDYFEIRKRRYFGSKAALQWLRSNDQTTFRLFDGALRNPNNLIKLKKLVVRVTKISI